jgi:hypothetical protein
VASTSTPETHWPEISLGVPFPVADLPSNSARATIRWWTTARPSVQGFPGTPAIGWGVGAKSRCWSRGRRCWWAKSITPTIGGPRPRSWTTRSRCKEVRRRDRARDQ